MWEDTDGDNSGQEGALAVCGTAAKVMEVSVKVPWTACHEDWTAKKMLED